MNCVFETREDGICVCVRGGCGRVVDIGRPCDKIVARCRGGRPDAAQRTVNYGKALAKDIAAGRPRRTEERIAEIKAICQSNSCGLYNAEHNWCEHRACGCDLDKKAAWEKEACPLRLWN